jgi:cytidyltransferase-like protein
MKSFLELVEEQKSGEHHHVMTFGRMNPPTTGHLKLIDKVHEVAKKVGGTHSIVTSHSQDAKKNPLSAEQKVKHIKRYSPESHVEASSKEHPTFLHHAAKLHKQGVSHLHMVVGSDRVKEMKEKLHKYNGSHEGALYNFKKIHVHSAGHRDPDAEGTTGMSGTKMREHAKNKDIKSFRQGVPSHVSDKHAHELMHDTRKGMGLHESVDRGMFKAIFVTGGPGSGKDIVIREAIASEEAIEMNSVQAFDYLMDKQRLSEQSRDIRREAIRTRGPLIINGPADDHTRILTIKEELEELGYETTMVFVDTTNEASRERNERLSKTLAESVRQDKWMLSQANKEAYSQNFSNFIYFDNSRSLEQIEEDVTETYQQLNMFIEQKRYSDVAMSWLESHGKFNINDKINLFKENRNVQKTPKFVYKTTNAKLAAIRPGDQTPDNRASAGGDATDSVKYNANKRTGGYAFGPGGTYTEETKKATLKVSPVPRESNFSKDKEKDKVSRFKTINSASGSIRSPGLGAEYDSRGQGVYAMSGLGNVTYSEQKDFKSFRNKVREAIDDPGACDMGVGGVAGGATNKEPMQTYRDQDRVGVKIVKKKK